MEFIRGLHNLQQRHVGCVATIGKFDGVHLGHRALIAALRQQAQHYELPLTVVIFEPLPEVVLGREPLPRLMNLREKYQALQEAGVDRLLCIHFNAAFANLTAVDFIRDILVSKLGVRYLLVGEDFRFGYQRRGDVALLEKAGPTYHYAVSSMPRVAVEGESVSSSAIRKALIAGDLSVATKLLGHTYSLCGRVLEGDKRGRTLGFPTANILLGSRQLPLDGVFAVKIHGLQRVYQGVANVGTRPTVAGTRLSLEVNLFDFSEDIYGRLLRIEFLKKIRSEQKFESLSALQQQIAQDVSSAKQFFKEIGA